MFDFSERNKKQVSTKKNNQWFEECIDCEVVISGAGVSALCAGMELQKRGLQVLLITGDPHPGGWLLGKNGPLEILSPADELLEDFEYPVDENPPLWIDRLELLVFLTNCFYRLGGMVLTLTSIQGKVRRREGNFELDLHLDDQTAGIEVPELIVTGRAEKNEETYVSCSKILEEMVLQTKRADSGYIEAGLRAYDPGDSDRFCPLINGFLLSGSKAARLLIADR